MKKILIVTLIAAAVLLELFYFRFHTYFQETVVNETLPVVSTTPSASGAPTAHTLVQGSFVPVDAIHKGSGTAKIVETNGTRYLQLENFQVTNGPDLYVYLSESKTPGGDLQSLDKYISLGRLKGNVGNQVYEIPKPFQGYDTAVIWCQQFGVLFSYAVME